MNMSDSKTPVTDRLERARLDPKVSDRQYAALALRYRRELAREAPAVPELRAARRAR